MVTLKLARSAAGIVLAALFCFLAQTPAHCQPWIADDSYVASQYENGDMAVDIWVCFGGASQDGCEGYGYWYIPGAPEDAHYDCNCSNQWATAYSGYWDFWANGPFGAGGDDWYADLYWTFYAPSVASSSCNACLECEENDPHDDTVYFDYYYQLYEYIEFGEY